MSGLVASDRSTSGGGTNVCERCGSPLSPGRAFCGKCGARSTDSTAAGTSAGTAAAPMLGKGAANALGMYVIKRLPLMALTFIV